MRRYLAATAAIVVTCTLAACSGDDPEAGQSPSGSTSGSTSESAGESPSPTSEETESGGTPTESAPPGEGLPEPGTAEAPARVEPAEASLEWSDWGDPAPTVTTGTKYVVVKDSEKVVNVGTAGSEDVAPIRAPKGYHWGDTLLDGQWAVVVAQHDQESQPAIATVIDLATGDRRKLDGRSELPTVNGGSWALGQGRVFHPTVGRDNAYCLAEVDLASLEGQTTYCAEPRTGFNNVRITPEGLSLMSFDSGRALSCRTVMAIGEASMEPFPAPECRGWEGLSMPGGDNVFTVVQKENRVELSNVVAQVGDGFYDLGPAVTGSLVWCDDAAWFSQDPQKPGDPSRLMRWDGEQLSVAYQGGDGGESGISAPRCGGDALAVSLLAESGDEQVTAPTR